MVYLLQSTDYLIRQNNLGQVFFWRNCNFWDKTSEPLDKVTKVFKNLEEPLKTVRCIDYDMILSQQLIQLLLYFTSNSEKKNRKWFVLKEAIAKLNHRPVQQSYFTSAYATTTPNSAATQNNVKEPNNKVNVYSIANLLP